MKHPLNKSEARKLVQKILRHGGLVFTDHTNRRLSERQMDAADVTNVLRCGRIDEEPEFENGAWRYRVHTDRMWAVVEIESESELVVITAWRKK